MSEAKLILFPVPLSEGDIDHVLPAWNVQLVKDVKFFIVENVRSARRFLKKCCREIDIDSLTFFTHPSSTIEAPPIAHKLAVNIGAPIDRHCVYRRFRSH